MNVGVNERRLSGNDRQFQSHAACSGSSGRAVARFRKGRIVPTGAEVDRILIQPLRPLYVLLRQKLLFKLCLIVALRPSGRTNGLETGRVFWDMEISCHSSILMALKDQALLSAKGQGAERLR